MKIVFLLQASSTFVKGGTELQADLIMSEAVKAGHEVFCVSDLLGEPGPGQEGVKYVYLKSRGRKFSVLNFFHLMKVLKRIGPDIIYQRFRVPYTGIAAWYARKNSCKMVFNTANVMDPRKNKVVLNRMFFFNFLNEHIERYGVKNSEKIVVQTDDQRKNLKRFFHRDGVIIRNGHPVPTPPFEKAQPPIVLWVSNVKPIKRLELFLDLARELKETRARFVCVGRPPNRKYCKVPEDKINNSENIEYLGELSYEETNDLIAKSSLLVNTSTSEGFPNTFIQAWMRETPVVSLDVDPDNLLETEGIGYCSRSFEKMAADVKALLKDEEKRRYIGKKARQYAIENHDIIRIGKNYLDLFKRLLNSTENTRADKDCHE